MISFIIYIVNILYVEYNYYHIIYNYITFLFISAGLKSMRQTSDCSIFLYLYLILRKMLQFYIT